MSWTTWPWYQYWIPWNGAVILTPSTRVSVISPPDVPCCLSCLPLEALKAGLHGRLAPDEGSGWSLVPDFVSLARLTQPHALAVDGGCLRLDHHRIPPSVTTLRSHTSSQDCPILIPFVVTSISLLGYWLQPPWISDHLTHEGYDLWPSMFAGRIWHCSRIGIFGDGMVCFLGLSGSCGHRDGSAD